MVISVLCFSFLRWFLTCQLRPGAGWMALKSDHGCPGCGAIQLAAWFGPCAHVVCILQILKEEASADMTPVDISGNQDCQMKAKELIEQLVAGRYLQWTLASILFKTCIWCCHYLSQVRCMYYGHQSLFMQQRKLMNWYKNGSEKEDIL